MTLLRTVPPDTHTSRTSPGLPEPARPPTAETEPASNVTVPDVSPTVEAAPGTTLAALPRPSHMEWTRKGQGDCMLSIYADDTAEGHILLRPIGELEAFTVPCFRQAVSELTSPADLVIDLSGVPFIDSAGLGALIGAIRRTRELGGQVSLACERSNLIRLLRNTGFDRIVLVAPTVEEATTAFHPDNTAQSAAATA